MGSSRTVVVVVCSSILAFFLCEATYGQTIHLVIAADEANFQGNAVNNIQYDSEMLQLVFQNMVPARQLRVHVVSPNNMNAHSILAGIDQCRIGPADALVFYYSGHGAFSAKFGHYLQTSKDPQLKRSTLLQKLAGKGARLTVILTDSCSEWRMPPEGKVLAAALPPEAAAPLMKSLFFGPVGLVDINSCSPGEISILRASDTNGSVFTYELLEYFGNNERIPQTWEHLFSTVRADASRARQQEAPGGGDQFAYKFAPARWEDLLKPQGGGAVPAP